MPARHAIPAIILSLSYLSTQADARAASCYLRDDGKYYDNTGAECRKVDKSNMGTTIAGFSIVGAIILILGIWFVHRMFRRRHRSRHDQTEDGVSRSESRDNLSSHPGASVPSFYRSDSIAYSTDGSINTDILRPAVRDGTKNSKGYSQKLVQDVIAHREQAATVGSQRMPSQTLGI